MSEELNNEQINEQQEPQQQSEVESQVEDELDGLFDDDSEDVSDDDTEEVENELENSDDIDSDDEEDEQEQEDEEDDSDDEDDESELEEPKNSKPAQQTQSEYQQNIPQQTQPQQPIAVDEFVRNNIKADFIPGTDEFFKAVHQKAIADVQATLPEGETFDEYNPQHTMKYQFYANREAQYRETEMRRGVEQAREEQYQRNVQSNLDNYLGSVLTTQELKDKFVEACDSLSVRTTRLINEQIAKGDLSGVKKIVEKIGALGNKIQQTKRLKQEQPLIKKQKRNGAPLASDLFL